MNIFNDLSMVDVTENIKSKGGFSYLSWPYAVSILLKKYPEATWTTQNFPARIDDVDCLIPYLKTPVGYFVQVSVTIDTITRTQLHPVLNYKNQPIDTPNNFEINASIQRCLVKAIGLQGLGLYIYAGEDLPIDAPPYTEDQLNEFFTLLEDSDALGMFAFLQGLTKDANSAIFNSFEKGEKTKGKEKIRALNNEANQIINDAVTQLTACVDNDDKAGITEIMDEVIIAKKYIWDRLEVDYQTQLRQILA